MVDSDSLSQQMSPMFARGDGVRLIPPGVDTDDYQLREPLGENLRVALARTLAEDSVGSIELLCASTPRYTDVVFDATGIPPHNTGRAHKRDENYSQDGTDRLVETLAETLPDWVGIERGRLNLDTVGFVPMLTARVVHEEKSTPAQVGAILRDVMVRNHRSAVPTLCQLLVSTGDDGSYRVSLRIAELTVRPRPLGNHMLTNVVSEPLHHGVESVLSAGLQSSRRLAADYWTTSEASLCTHGGGDHVLHERMATIEQPGSKLTELPTPTPAAQRSLRLLSGVDEYAGLLAGEPDCELYTDFDVESTLQVNPEGLQSLLDVFPLITGCRWPSGTTRTQPLFRPQTVISEAVGTAVDHPQCSAPTGVSVGRTIPETVVGFANQWLTEAGCFPHRVTDRTRGQPHLLGHPSSEDGPVVVADPTAARSAPAIETPGELVMAANRAFRANTHLVVVAPSKQTAQWAHNVLAVPYDHCLDNGTTAVYTVPETVTHGEGGIVASPVNGDDPVWAVITDGRLRLQVGDRSVGDASITTPLEAYTYGMPRIIQDGSQVFVSHPDGTTREYASIDSCTAEYRPIERPILPVWPTFIGEATVAYRDGRDLTAVRNRHRWPDRSQRRPIDSDLEAALETFISVYTSPTSAQGEGASQFGTVLETWLYSQVECPLPSVTLELRLPTDVQPKTTASGHIHGLQNRDWRIPATNLELRRANGGIATT